MHAKSLQSCLTLTPWAVACQSPLSMEFSRQEYWSGLPWGSFLPRDRTHVSCVSCVAGVFFTMEPPGVAVGKCPLSRKSNIYLILTAHLVMVGDLTISSSHGFYYQLFCNPHLKAHPRFPWRKAYLFPLCLSLPEQRNLMAILPADAGRVIMSTPFSQSLDSLSLSSNLEPVSLFIAPSGLLAPV